MAQEYYLSMIRNAEKLAGGKKIKDRKLEGGLYYLSQRMNKKYVPVSEESRVSFYLAFGILPSIQKAMEQRYQNLDLEWCSSNCTVRHDRCMFETKCI
jgi:hypothetical protein